jgi:phosphoadenosine phosphosulfate reductase
MSNPVDPDRANDRLERMNPAEILDWAVHEAFADRVVAATSSFQGQSLVLLYLISRVCPRVPVYFLDTGYHFPETLAYIDDLRRRLGLDIRTIEPLKKEPDFTMYREDPDMCCYLRKVEPLQRAFKGVDVWVSGIRRDQTDTRKQARILEANPQLGVMKLAPMANVTADVLARLTERIDLPEHPLRAEGFVSIGCMPCTTLPTVAGDERSGRWAGKAKTECGLHLPVQPPGATGS